MVLVIVAPAQLLYTAPAALMRPRQRERATRAWTAVRWLPAAGFAGLLLVVVTLNFPGDQRPDNESGVDERGRHCAQCVRRASRLGIYVCARVVVCDNPPQQGRVGWPARTGYAINVT